MSGSTHEKPAVRKPCPFTVIVDSREQLPYEFTDQEASRKDKKGRRVIYDVPVRRATLHTGDYSIEGMESKVTVERKSLDDLYGSIGRYENFVGRLRRMNDDFVVGAIVIEAELSVFLRGSRHSKITPKQAFASINAWTQRFPRVHWWWSPGRYPDERRMYAAHITFRILERAWDRITNPKEMEDVP